MVSPALAPPVRYRGRIYIRLGPRRDIASPDEERRLAERRRFSDLPFDLQPLVSASLEDLDLGLFRREYLPRAVEPSVLMENRRDPLDQMRALRLVAPSGHPTVLGMLVLGKDPTVYVPGAYIQFVRFDGQDLASSPARDQKDLSGPLSQVLRSLEDVLAAHNEVGLRPTDAVASPRPEYPLEALRQLARNAIMHRNYATSSAPVRVYWFDDRIEIQSPGGPYGQVTVENFGSGVTDYRNPHLAEAMRVLGYVQRFGVGLPIAERALAENGNPPPRFTITSTSVLVTIERLVR